MFLRVILSTVACLVISATAPSQTVPPSIFFTDLTYGANAGGENGNGAYVTIYGNNFGTSQGTSTVTWNGQSCLNVVPATGSYTGWGMSYLWYQKIVVQLTSACTPGTGKFVVTVNGISSTDDTSHGDTGAGFTVDTSSNSHIKCVSVGGSGNGTFSGGCSGDLRAAIHGAAAGDIIYAENGVSVTNGDTQSDDRVAINLTSGGTASKPIAAVAYPGATVTVGTTSLEWGGFAYKSSYWNIVGMTVRGNDQGMWIIGTNHVRAVADDLECPSPNGADQSCFNDADSPYTWLYGVVIHDCGGANTDKTQHGLYWGALSNTANSNYAWFGWGEVYNIKGGRGLQYYSNYGATLDMTGTHVHDSVIHDVQEDGINLVTADPDTSTVEAYNNVLWNVGKGPDNGGDFACINVSSANSHTNYVKIYNNTCLNAGVAGNSNSGSISNAYSVLARYTNNIYIQLNGRPYLNGNGCGIGGSHFTQSTNNLFYGNGSPPSCSGLSGSLNVNPQVVSTSTPDLHLSSSSTMIGAGTGALFPIFDHDGLIRSNPPSIGANEFSGGTSVSKPNPPTDLAIVVN